MNPQAKLVLKAWPVITLATLAICFITTHLAGAAGWHLHSQSSVSFVLGKAGWNMDFLWIVFKVLVLAPLVEEVVFRYLLWRLPAPGRENVLAVESAALFSAAHYIMMPWPDNAFAALFFFGLAQCWLYKFTGQLWCAVMNHSLFNLTTLVLLLVLPEKFVVS